METMYQEELNPWSVFMDKSKTSEGNGMGVVLVSPHGEEMKLAIWLHFKAFDNKAEYKVLLVGL